MSYPTLPKNRILVKVDGSFIDLTERFKMVLADGFTLNPPEPKTYYVDIPGSDGKIDLTETLLGRTAFSNRLQEFTFYIFDVENAPVVKDEITRFLHGKAFDYQLTFDPGYIYNGRFTIKNIGDALYNNVGRMIAVSLSIEAKPFKTKDGVKYL